MPGRGGRPAGVRHMVNPPETAPSTSSTATSCALRGSDRRSQVRAVRPSHRPPWEWWYQSTGRRAPTPRRSERSGSRPHAPLPGRGPAPHTGATGIGVHRTLPTRRSPATLSPASSHHQSANGFEHAFDEGLVVPGSRYILQLAAGERGADVRVQPHVVLGQGGLGQLARFPPTAGAEGGVQSVVLVRASSWASVDSCWLRWAAPCSRSSRTRGRRDCS
jgi:hypothetical protein